MNLEPIKARREALTALNIKDFYAHAPTDIAELVAEVERLQAVVEASHYERATDHCTCCDYYGQETQEDDG